MTPQEEARQAHENVERFRGMYDAQANQRGAAPNVADAARVANELVSDICLLGRVMDPNFNRGVRIITEVKRRAELSLPVGKTIRLVWKQSALGTGFTARAEYDERSIRVVSPTKPIAPPDSAAGQWRYLDVTGASPRAKSGADAIGRLLEIPDPVLAKLRKDAESKQKGAKILGKLRRSMTEAEMRAIVQGHLDDVLKEEGVEPGGGGEAQGGLMPADPDELAAWEDMLAGGSDSGGETPPPASPVLAAPDPPAEPPDEPDKPWRGDAPVPAPGDVSICAAALGVQRTDALSPKQQECLATMDAYVAATRAYNREFHGLLGTVRGGSAAPQWRTGLADASFTLDPAKLRELDETTLDCRTHQFRLSGLGYALRALVEVSPELRGYYGLFFRADGFSHQAAYRAMQLNGRYRGRTEAYAPGDVGYFRHAAFTDGGAWGVVLQADGQKVTEVLVHHGTEADVYLRVEAPRLPCSDVWWPAPGPVFAEDSDLGRFWGPGMSRLARLLDTRSLTIAEFFELLLAGQRPRGVTSVEEFTAAVGPELTAVGPDLQITPGSVVIGAGPAVGVFLGDHNILGRKIEQADNELTSTSWLDFGAVSVWVPRCPAT